MPASDQGMVLAARSGLRAGAGGREAGILAERSTWLSLCTPHGAQWWGQLEHPAAIQ